MSSVDELLEDFDPRVITLFLGQPASVPPPGVVSNLENPPSHSADGNVDLSICLVVASLTFFIRMYTKIFLMRQFWLEDFVLLLAYLVFLAMIIVGLRYIHQGLYNQWDIRVKDLTFYIYNARIISILYGISLAAAKVTILLQYLRVFVPLKRRGYMYWSCHILIWLNICLYFACIFVVTFQCKPVDFAYKPIGLLVLSGDACIDVYVFLSTTAAMNVALDFVMLLLPQRAIWKLKISRKRKIGVSAVFAVGIFACVASVMRLYYSVEAVRRQHELSSLTNMGLWMIPEVACGIMIASLPVVPRFFTSLREGWLGSGHSSSAEPKASQQGSSNLDSAGTKVDPEQQQRVQLDKEPEEDVVQPEADTIESESSESSEEEFFDGTFDLSTFEGPPIPTLRSRLSDSQIGERAARGVWLDNASISTKGEDINGENWRSTI